MNPRPDYKEVSSDAYYEAIENGATEDEAHKAAQQALEDWSAARADAAKDAWKERGL